MDPAEFEKICEQIGADNIYKVLCSTMGTERMSNEGKYLKKLRAMVVIYMMYSHSQRVNLFQVTLATTLQQFGIIDQGLASLRNLGIAAHPRAVKAAIQSSSTSHFDNVIRFFQKAVENEHFLIFYIDDYRNIHTKHRPEAKTQTEAVLMSTLLVKVFPNVKAVSKEGLHSPLLLTLPVEPEYLFKLINSNMAGLSQSYSANMPDWVICQILWVIAKYTQSLQSFICFLFGNKAKLAKKPLPWRVSLLLEVLYGGWTLVRDSILSTFYHSKDVEFLTIFNLVDNYVPLVLSVYSIVFKCNDYDLYCKSLLRCWVMFMVFHRRH